MSVEAYDSLLEQLGNGDAEAAERVFRDYEPYLRMIVRRRLTPSLRSKFDSIDIVQSVWTNILVDFHEEGWQFQDRNHLRAFLARSTYNRFIDHCRRHRRELQLEQSPGGDGSFDWPDSSEPRGSEVVQADDVWDLLMKVCNPNHRELLELKRQGASLAEIAAKTGMHPSSVRRILYDLARRMAAAEGASSPSFDAAS